MYCTNCGKEIADGINFCGFCGQKIEKTQSKAEESDPDKNDVKQEMIDETIKGEGINKEDAYETEEANNDCSLKDEETKKSDLSEESNDKERQEDNKADNRMEKDPVLNMSALIGKNQEYYLREFEKIEKGEKSKFNWAAFFFGPIITLYRKQFDAFKKYILVPTLLTLVASGIVIAGIGSFNLSLMTAGVVLSVIAAVVTFIFILLLGKRFNGLYYANLKKILNADVSRSDKLAKTGTTVKYIVIYFVCNFVIYMIISGLSTAVLLSGTNDYGADYSDKGFIASEAYSDGNKDTDKSGIESKGESYECPDYIVDLYCGTWWEYYYENCMIDIKYGKNNCFYISIECADEYETGCWYLWDMTAHYDEYSDSLIYEDCVSKVTYFDENVEMQEELRYTDGEGTFYFSDGFLYWNDLEEGVADGYYFYYYEY